MAKIYIPAAGECEILDDIDFMVPARTVHFSLNGVHYEVDLSDQHVGELQELLRPYITVSHVVGREDI